MKFVGRIKVVTATSGFNIITLLIIVGSVVGFLVLAAIVTVVLILVLRKPKSGGSTSSAEALLMQHEKMHSRHKQLINDYHQHKRLSEEDKKKIEERNLRRGADPSENPLQDSEGEKNTVDK